MKNQKNTQKRNKKYTEKVTVRFTDKQFKLIKEHAEADGITVTKLIRNRATLYCDK